MNEPKLVKIKSGWAAHGNGWAVHAPTKDEVIKKYHERKKFYIELLKLPLWCDNPKNPERVQPMEYKIFWCNRCDNWYVECPKCGNNSCNGGYGTIDGKKCDVCPSAYACQKEIDELLLSYEKVETFDTMEEFLDTLGDE